METINRYSTFSFQDNGDQCTLDPLAQRRSGEWAIQGLLPSACVWWYKGHLRLLLLGQVSKTMWKENTYKPRAWGRVWLPRLQGALWMVLKAWPPELWGWAGSLSWGGSRPVSLQGMSWSLCLLVRGQGPRSTASHSHCINSLKEREYIAERRGSCPGSHSPHQGLDPFPWNS